MPESHPGSHHPARSTSPHPATIPVAEARRARGDAFRDERLTVVAKIGHLIAGNLELRDLLDLATGAIRDVFGYEHVAILLADAADRGSGSLVSTAAGDRYAALTARLTSAAATARDTELALSIRFGARELGVLHVESARPFTTDEAPTMRVVADQLAVAIEHARLREALRALAHATWSEHGVLAETALAISEPRKSDPRTAGLDLVRHDGLLVALRTCAKELDERGIRVAVRCREWARQHGDCDAGLYRIAREALGNVAKHAAASEAEVELTARDGLALLTVRDNGAGFEPWTERTRRDEGSERSGLQAMREWAIELGGQLLVHSAPGQGTLIEARVPIRIWPTL